MIAAQVMLHLGFWIAFFYIFGQLSDMNRKESLKSMTNGEIVLSEVLLAILALAIISPLIYFSGGNVGAAFAFCLFLGVVDITQSLVMARSDWDASKMNKFRAASGLVCGLYLMAINMVFYGHVLPKMVPAVN